MHTPGQAAYTLLLSSRHGPRPNKTSPRACYLDLRFFIGPRASRAALSQRLGTAIPSAIWHSPGTYSQITVRVHPELNQITFRAHSDHAIYSTFCISYSKRILINK